MTKITKDVECMEMIRRNLYLDKIRPFIDQDLIKVLIGLRRSGKTILLSQIRDVLLERGVPKENIIEINLSPGVLKSWRMQITSISTSRNGQSRRMEKYISFLTRSSM